MTHTFTPLAGDTEQRTQTGALLRRARLVHRAATSRRIAAAVAGLLLLLALSLSPALVGAAAAAVLLTFALSRRLWWARAEHDSYVTHLVNAGTLERTPAS